MSDEFIKDGYRCCNQNQHIYITETTKAFEILIVRQDICDILCKYNINEEEFYVLLMMYYRGYKIIQHDILNNSLTEFSKECVRLFDALLLKTPSTSHIVVYRQENKMRIEDFEILKEFNEPLICRHFLTCSSDDFDNGSIKLIITPKASNSKAHDVYRIYNYPENVPYPENQINFERNSKFEITKIVKNNNIPNVYLKEL